MIFSQYSEHINPQKAPEGVIEEKNDFNYATFMDARTLQGNTQHW